MAKNALHSLVTALCLLGGTARPADRMSPASALSQGAAQRSPGCSSAPWAGRPGLRTIADGAGVSRTFYVSGPQHLPPGQALALVIVLHAGGGTAADAMHLGLGDIPDAADTALFVYPQGRPFETFGTGWNDTCGGYDMVFYDNIVASLEASDCIDTNRIFVAGFSWGCDFATALACCRGDQIRAIAATACSDEFRDPADVKTYANLSCPVPTKAAVRFTHAVEEDAAYPRPLFATTSRLFRMMNGCSDAASQTADRSCVAFSGCRQPFEECALPGVGHTPGPGWAKATWSFFSRFR